MSEKKPVQDLHKKIISLYSVRLIETRRILW